MILTIPYIAFLGLYAIFLVIMLFLGFSSLYHLLKFGFFSPTSITMTFIMLAGTVYILFASYQELMMVDWSQSLDIGLLWQDINPL